MKDQNKVERSSTTVIQPKVNNETIYKTKAYFNKVRNFTPCDPKDYKNYFVSVATATQDKESIHIAKDVLKEILETIPSDVFIDIADSNSSANSESNSVDKTESNLVDNTESNTSLDASLVELDNDEVTDSFGDPIPDTNENPSSTTDSLN